MTQENLDALDAELKAGSITDEDYMQALTDEVCKLHPDIDAYEVDNMVRMQLKTLAVDEQYHTNAEETPPVVEMGYAPNDKGEKESAACKNGEDEAAPADNSSDAQQMESDAEGSEADSEQAGSEQDESQSEDGDAESSSSGQDEDGDKTPKDDKGDEEDQSSSDDNSSNDDSNGGGNQTWWTWQIVPGWLTLGNATT